MGHVDHRTQLLHETLSQGTTIHWLHVPSHIRADGNTHAERLADIGCRHPPVLTGQVTVSLAGGESLDESESEPESDLEAPIMWTTMEGMGDHGTPLPARHTESNEERERRSEQPLRNPPPPPPPHSKRPLHNPNAVVATLNMSRPKSMGRGGLVDIKVCTLPSRAPCPSTGRSTPPSHWRSRAQFGALAPHSPPTRSLTRIDFHSPNTHSLSTNATSTRSTEGSQCVTPIKMSPPF